MSLTLAEQVQTLAGYLPSGRAFGAKSRPGTGTYQLLQGLAGELLRSDALIQEFRDEILPDETVLFLEEWESAVGIPDHCFSGQGTVATRRRDVLAKLVSLGAQTEADFIYIAEQIFEVNISITRATPGGGFPYTFGVNVDPPDYANQLIFGLSDREARFTLIVNFDDLPLTAVFPYIFPITFGTTEMVLIQCIFNRLKPANVDVLYTSSV